jgi:hypothetical protein
MNKLIGIAAATLVVTTGIVASGTAAQAAAVSAGCSVSNGWNATGGLEYTNSGTNHNVSRYVWTINGQSGSTQNNVDAQVRHDINNAPDDQLHHWSTGGAHNGSGSHAINMSWPATWNLFGQFGIVFDRNNASDPSCTIHTPRF